MSVSAISDKNHSFTVEKFETWNYKEFWLILKQKVGMQNFRNYSHSFDSTEESLKFHT